MKAFALGAAIICLSAPIAATAQDASFASALVSVNGVTISQAELDHELHASGQPDTPELRRELKRTLIVRELLRQNAEKEHYGTRPEVQRNIDAAKGNAEVRLYWKANNDNIRPEPVTDAQVKAVYDEMAASGENFRPRVLALPDVATAAKVLNELKAGKPFKLLVDQYSRHDGIHHSENGRKEGWTTLEGGREDRQLKDAYWPPAVAQAIRQLPAGGIAPEPIQVDGKWVVVTVEARSPALMPAFDAMKDSVRQSLQTKAREKAVSQFVDARAASEDVVVTQAQLDDAVRASHKEDTPELRQSLRLRLIIRALARRLAEREHYDTSPEIRRAVDVAKANAEGALYVNDHIGSEQVSEAQIKAHYDATAHWVDEYKPRFLALFDASTVTEVTSLLKAGEPFELLASKYGNSERDDNPLYREEGSENAWLKFKTPLTEGETNYLPLVVAQAITQLPEGSVTPEPIRVNDKKWLVVKLDAKRARQVPEFASVKDSIRRKLQRQQLIDRLMKSATIVE